MHDVPKEARSGAPGRYCTGHEKVAARNLGNLESRAPVWRLQALAIKALV